MQVEQVASEAVAHIPLAPEAARAVAAWTGTRVPPGAWASLIGTEMGSDARDGAPRGTKPCPLPSDWAPSRRWWWVEDAAAVSRWLGDGGRAARRRWPLHWVTGGGTAALGAKTCTMGIVNATPDSFSDGGRWSTDDALREAAQALLAAGVDWVDVGGESTRPGHTPVEAPVEWARIAPLLEGLPPAALRAVSVDTRHPEVAHRAAALGVAVLNDVSCLEDPAWLAVLRHSRSGYVLMYNRAGGASGRLDWRHVLERLGGGLDRLASAGVPLDRVMLDPGLGFAYSGADNVAMLNNLGLLRIFNRPVLVGPSRKRFIGRLTGRPVEDRDRGSAIAAFAAAKAGADVLRMHDAAAALDAARMADGWGSGRE